MSSDFPKVILVEMTETEFSEFRSEAIGSYAREKVELKAWSESDAITLSKQAFHSLLPDALKSKNHFFFSIRDAGTSEKVGYIWYEIRDDGLMREDGLSRELYLYYIWIFQPYRKSVCGKHYAASVMSELEHHSRDRSIRKISLRVSGKNVHARALYCGTGYEETDVYMTKVL